MPPPERRATGSTSTKQLRFVQRLTLHGSPALCLSTGGFDIDVAALHQAYVRGARSRGVRILRQHGARGLAAAGDGWQVRTDADELRCGVVVNAAGAWADEVAALAGARELGMRPLRRTVFTFTTSYDCDEWPLVISADETFYFKPEGPGQLLGSPADEHLDRPGDARPREIDVALGIEAVNRATTLAIRAVRSTWAGTADVLARPRPGRRISIRRRRDSSGAPVRAAPESRLRRRSRGSRLT